jgi:hypothetical protein
MKLNPIVKLKLLLGKSQHCLSMEINQKRVSFGISHFVRLQNREIGFLIIVGQKQ